MLKKLNQFKHQNYLILLFVVLSCSGKNRNDDLQDQDKYFQNLISKHCYYCVSPSLADFQRGISGIEKTYQDFDSVSIDLLYKLTDSYNELIYYFYNNNKQKQFEFSDKKIELMKSIIQLEANDRQKIKLHRKIIEAYLFKNTLSNKEEIINLDGISQHKKNLRGIGLKEYQQSKDMLKIKDVANQGAISSLDYKFINELINNLVDLPLKPSKFERSLYRHSINTLFHIISLNNLSKELNTKLMRSIIIAKEYSFNRGFLVLNDIVWWCQARSIENKSDQLQFLNNQMLSNRKLDALKLLIEKGRVEEIKFWSQKLKFENSKSVFELAIKQAQHNESY